MLQRLQHFWCSVAARRLFIRATTISSTGAQCTRAWRFCMTLVDAITTTATDAAPTRTTTTTTTTSTATAITRSHIRTRISIRIRINGTRVTTRVMIYATTTPPPTAGQLRGRPLR